MAKKPATARQTAKPSGAFQIESGVEVPSRTTDVPDYGVPFDQLKPGQSVVLPFDQIPLAHARLITQRFARKASVQMITRTEKDADGEAIGLRVWRAE